ncbi:hypothetical protein ACO0SA_004851 [Hanseniaspora valbyensis]
MSEENKIQFIFLRHGQSTLNSKNLFCGWIDPPLTDIGIEQAKTAASEIHKHLQKTNNIDLPAVSFYVNINPAMKDSGYNFFESWRLNERHYGSWQGQNKKKIQYIVGDNEYMRIRRDYQGKPPNVNLSHEMEQPNKNSNSDDNDMQDNNDSVKEIKKDESSVEYEFKEPNRLLKYNIEYQFGDLDLPISESLSDVLTRITPLLHSFIVPKVVESDNKTGMIIAHGSSIRAILMILCGLNEDEIKGVNIPNGMPMVIELTYTKHKRHGSNDNQAYDLTLNDRYYLDPELAKQKAEQVKMEGRN